MADLPTWKDRLKACFRWRHRLMHVFGAPAAVGAMAAVASSAALNPEVGLSLGLLTASVGTALAGYFVTAGFDKGLNDQLIEEAEEAEMAEAGEEVQAVIWNADPQIRPLLERVVWYYDSIEAVFNDGHTDTVEAVLEGSRTDLKALRDRALSMSKLYVRLRHIIQSSDPRYLQSEIERMDKELRRTKPGATYDVLAAAKESTERTLAQWQTAVDKQKQITGVLTMIESNLQEFKLAMELKKADAAMGAETAGAPNVTELQSRLQAATDACDELVGARGRRRRRARRSA